MARTGIDAGREGERCEVSIVMPCLNEAETLGSCIEKARRGLSSLGITGEIVVADNGSSDGSQAIATKLGARRVHVEPAGYGSALLGGISAARGRYVIMGDADDTYDFATLGPFVEKLRQGYDVVVGNRFRGGIEPGAMPWLHRFLGNPVLSAIGRLFFRSPCGDFHCGLRAIRRDRLPELDLRSRGMEFATEMVVKATLRGLRITEVPTTLSRSGRSRAPHLRTWRDGWRHLRFLLLYSPRWLFLYPGAILMLSGLALMLLILPGSRDIGGVSLDVHTLVYAGVATILGFQAVVFAAVARIFAMVEGFLPEQPRLRWLLRFITLEVGLATGCMLLLAGLGASVYAVVMWGQDSFGELDYSETMRVVVPAAVLLTLGCQTILSSFFLSFLGLKDPTARSDLWPALGSGHPDRSEEAGPPPLGLPEHGRSQPDTPTTPRL